MQKKPGAGKKKTGARGAKSASGTAKAATGKKTAKKRARSTSADGMERLLQERTEELRMHQIELEMQNEELRTAQQLLEASRARYADLYNLAPVAYFSFDAGGLITEVNLAGARLLGREKQLLMSKPFLLFLHPEDRRIFEEHERAARATGARQACDVRLQHRDGRVVHARLESIAGTKAAAETEDGILTAVIDITWRKQADEALRRSEDRFRVAQDLSLDAFTILTALRNRAGAIEDFQWEYVNPMAGRYLRHPPADLVGRRLLQVLPGNRKSGLFARYVRVVETGEPHDYELAYEADGISGWFRNMAVRLDDGIAVYFSDITGRKRAELELKQRAEEYRTLAENSPDFIARHDRQYRHIYVNRKIAEFEGRSRQDFTGKTLEEIGFPAHIATAWNGIFQRVFASGKEESIETSFPGPDGPRTIHQTLVPEFGPDGSVQTVLAIGRDITELKRAEDALRRERDKAQQYLDIAGTLIVAVEPDGTVTLINQKGCSLLGYPEGEILSKNWFDHFIPEDERDAVWELFTGVVQGRRQIVEQQEDLILTRDRRVRLICWHNSLVRDESGAISGMISSGEDITERRKAETALQESEERNRNLLNVTPLGMLLVRNDRIAWVNPAAVRLFGGRNEQEVLAKRPFDLFQAAYHSSVKQLERDLKSGLPVKTTEQKIVTLDGKERDVEVTPVSFVSGNRSGTLVMLNDITLRKQAEAALQQSEARLRALFEKAGDAIFVLEAEGAFAGRILSANQAAADMHGYTIAQLTTMSIRDLDAPEDAGQVPDRLARIMAGEWIKCEITHRRRDGSHFPVEISSGLIISGNQKLILGFDRDITERKKAEESVRESREQYLRLFNTVSDGIVLHPFKTPDDRGSFITANDTICRMLGYTEREMQTRCLEDIVLAEQADGNEWEKELWRRQGFYVHNKTLITKSGQSIPAEISSRLFKHNGVQMALSVIRDVTERRKTEDLVRHLNRDLRQRVSELETIFNTAPIGLAIVRDPDCTYVRRNAAYLRALGVSDDNEIEHDDPEFAFQVFFGDRRLSRDEHPLQRAVKGEVVTGQIFDIKRRDGQTITLHSSAAPLLDEQGQPCGAVGAFLDITGLIRAEDEITKLNRDLQQNVQELRDANRELEAFIYSVSHDLRAPLRSIRGFSEFLLHDYRASLDDRGEGYLDRVVKNTMKMDRLIDDLLHLSRISRQHLERKDIDLSRIVSELAVELRNADPERKVSLRVQEGLTDRADPRLIAIALENLLNNAWKFTLRTAEPMIEFGLGQEDGKTSYFVRDNGAGFDQQYADKLFLPFHRLHSEQEFEGSGIGLAIVERVIRRHSGKVWAEGKPGAGAVFYFTLSD